MVRLILVDEKDYIYPHTKYKMKWDIVLPPKPNTLLGAMAFQ
jgi:hypothetical protein